MSSTSLSKSLKAWFRSRIAPTLVYGFYRSLMATWKVTVEEPPSLAPALAGQQPVIFAHWHGDELALIHLARHFRIATITSTSKDGELMNAVLHRLGAVTARGSSSKGGANALRGLIQLCRRGGHNVSFAVDGPKGPVYKVKPGVFEFSRLMDAPIYVASIGVSRPWVSHRSWNKAVLPAYFSTVVVRITEGLPPVTREQDPRDPALAARLEAMLAEGKREMCARVGVERP